jgi:hypothetical protein
MAGWELVPCLGCLRAELNLIAPNRDKTTDGTIGDSAHQSNISDHNDDEIGRVPIRDADSKHEVHALDLDTDLREPNLTMEMVVQHVLARCRSGLEKRLRYIIYNRRIWEASNGWRQRKYDGSSPHTEHAHFSASYETKHEASTASWHLEDIPVALTNADRNWLVEQVDKRHPGDRRRTQRDPHREDRRPDEQGSRGQEPPDRPVAGAGLQRGRVQRHPRCHQGRLSAGGPHRGGPGGPELRDGVRGRRGDSAIRDPLSLLHGPP